MHDRGHQVFGICVDIGSGHIEMAPNIVETEDYFVDLLRKRGNTSMHELIHESLIYLLKYGFGNVKQK